MPALILCSSKGLGKAKWSRETAKGRRKEDQCQEVRNVQIGNQRRMHPTLKASDVVLGDFRGKGNGCKHRGHQDSSPGFLFLLLGMVGEVDQEIPWLSGTTDGEGTKKNQTRGLEGARRGATAWHSWCVYMAGSLDGTQWSRHPVRLAVSTGYSQEELPTYIPGGPRNQLEVQGDLLGSLISSIRGPRACV